MFFSLAYAHIKGPTDLVHGQDTSTGTAAPRHNSCLHSSFPNVAEQLCQKARGVNATSAGQIKL